MGKRIQPPTCMTCGAVAEIRAGSEVHPKWRKLWNQFFWVCPTPKCDSHCSCHSGTKRPLGRPAGPEVRKAREILRKQMIDPIWQGAERLDAYDNREWRDAKAAKMIQNRARSRVYAFLAHEMKIDKEVCHVGMFSIEQCREAWRALRGVTYSTIRTWAKMREQPAPADNVVPFKRKA